MVGKKPITSDAGSKDKGMLGNGWRGGLFAGSLVLLTCAAIAWFPDTPPTIQTNIEDGTETTIAPKTRKAPTTAARTTVKRTHKTTKTLRGRQDQAKTAEPDGAARGRSDTVTIALLGSALVLFVLAAVGRVPSKVGKEGVEFVVPPAAAVAEFADRAAKEGLTGQPERLHEAARRLVRTSAESRPDSDEQGRALARTAVDSVTSPGDD